MEFEITHKRLYRSLLNMVEWTKQLQKGFPEIKKHLSTKAWAKEQATIKFALPRQSGHTTFALKLFQEYFQNAVLVFPHHSIKNCVLSNHNIPNELKSRISTPAELSRFYGFDIEAVIIDCASLISSSDKEYIYDFFTPYVQRNPLFYFIFLE